MSIHASDFRNIKDMQWSLKVIREGDPKVKKEFMRNAKKLETARRRMEKKMNEFREVQEEFKRKEKFLVNSLQEMLERTQRGQTTSKEVGIL